MTKLLRLARPAAGLTAALLLAAAPAALAQNVGIGTTTPNAKALLELSATDRGMLIPRMTAAQRTAISSPPQGLMVYQTDGTASGGTQTGFWYYAGTPAAWVYLSPATTPTGTAGGDLAGTYPNPTVNTGAIGTTKLADNAVTNVKVADDAIGIAELSATGTASSSTYLRGDNTWAALTSNAWGLTGNVLNGSQFLGSTNNEDLVFRRNNAEAFRVYGNGRVSLGTNTEASASVILGFNAGVAHSSAVYNVIIGARAGEATNSNNNTLIGYGAGQRNTGSSNTLLGFYAGNNLTSGSDNVFIGNTAGYNGATGITGANNIVIGTSSGTNLTTNNNNILIGGSAQAAAGLYGAYAFGNNAVVTQSQSLAIGNEKGTNDALRVGIGTSAPHSSLQVNGTFAVGVQTGYSGGGSTGGANGLDQGTPNATDIGGSYYALTPAGTSTQHYRLPNASTCTGRIYYLRNASSSVVARLSVSSGPIIDGTTTITSGNTFDMNTTGSSKVVTAISDGTNWIIIRTGI